MVERRKDGSWARDPVRARNAQSAGRKRTEAAIRKAYKAGKRPSTDKRLAGMMDRLYKTDFVNRYHGGER